ncbi:hypothetical protein GGR58DRAFT_527494 [Xylaria digitata]|nr:hypothetical protein GGR58DRAFT_527494 [Xylaria digitata]
MSQSETPSVRRIGFTRLSRTRSPTVNIVFVHGLRGHPQTTWGHRQVEANERPVETSHRRHHLRKIFGCQFVASTQASVDENVVGSNVFWPQDYLPEDVSEAEVWTYGYNADVIGGLFQANNQNSVSQHGRDLAVKLERDIENQAPIIFVAHSLGGIVVKDAIRRSEHFQSRTKLIVFLGTPHRGSSSAGWGVIASNLAKLAFQDSNKRIIQTLEPNSEVLDNIHDEFLKVVHEASIKVHSFQEARAISGVKGLDGKVVDDYSSKIGLPPSSETVESIDANHTQIAKCRNKTDPQYRAIVGVLKQFIRSGKLSGDDIRAQECVPATQIEPQGISPQGETRAGRSNSFHQSRHYLSFSKNKRFTGRDAILNTLKDKLFTREEAQKLAVVGLGGVGKTQVALQLAFWVKNNQPDYSVFWVPVLGHASFEQAYAEIARRLDIQIKDDEGLKVSVRRYLESERAGKWLLVVDNADDTEIVFGSSNMPGGIYKYLPESDNGLTLFTTRSREVAVAVAGSEVVDLHNMSVEEATGFFEKALIDKQLLQDRAITEELLQELTCLPLAIAQAAAYLNQHQMSIRRYLALLRATEQDLVNLMTREFHDNTRYQGSQNAVAMTWLVSFDQIRRSDSNAAKLLAFMSCIEPKAIPQSILPMPPVQEEMEHAIGVLCGYAFLVRRGDDDMFDMHRLVHIATQVWVQRENIINETKADAIGHLASIFPWDDEENRSLWREYLPHVQHALQVGQEYQHNQRFDLFYRVGRCLYEDRRFIEAIIAFEETVRWHKQHLPEDNSSRLSYEHALASAYLYNRQVGKAITILEHVVAIEKETLKEEDHNRLASEHELARAYLEDGQVGKAITILKHVVAIEKETLKEEDRNRLASEYALASAYLTNRQVGKAIVILEHVVAVKKTLKKKDSNRLASEHELAKAYLKNRQVGKAIAILEHVVAVEKHLDISDKDRSVPQDLLTKAYSMLPSNLTEP